MGINKDVDMTRVGVDPQKITTWIDIRDAWSAKKAAGQCHQSQRGGSGLAGRLPVWALARLMPREPFVRIHPEPWPGLTEKSFFD
jgi:LmbE family N-acetylglucosaminyl deacetylase